MIKTSALKRVHFLRGWWCHDNDKLSLWQSDKYDGNRFHFQGVLQYQLKRMIQKMFLHIFALDLERYTSLENEYNHLVRFEISGHRKDSITLDHRRLNRVLNRHSRYPPLNMFAHWILESILLYIRNLEFQRKKKQVSSRQHSFYIQDCLKVYSP